jgi:hypothetical protein
LGGLGLHPQIAILEAAEAVGDDRAKARALGSLAAHLPEARRIEVLDRALSAAEAIGNDWGKAQALGSLAERHRDHGNYSFMNRISDYLPALNRVSALSLLNQISLFIKIDEAAVVLLIKSMLYIFNR